MFRTLVTLKIWVKKREKRKLKEHGSSYWGKVGGSCQVVNTKCKLSKDYVDLKYRCDWLNMDYVMLI